mmetsp:Transcript_5284/g.8173  ORF Transcript_5284/g.8173 Transcript_5284/m.8173 type:complete len:83 (+) Transcript_5284:423-671(+)
MLTSLRSRPDSGQLLSTLVTYRGYKDNLTREYCCDASDRIDATEQVSSLARVEADSLGILFITSSVKTAPTVFASGVVVPEF